MGVFNDGINISVIRICCFNKYADILHDLISKKKSHTAYLFLFPAYFFKSFIFCRTLCVLFSQKSQP